jgi:hypothetical protein
MKKRLFLAQAGLSMTSLLLPSHSTADSLQVPGRPGGVLRRPPGAESNARVALAGAWHTGGAQPSHRVGLLRPDWSTGQMRVESELLLPSRPHGLMAEAGGGFLVVASRPGLWLLRCDPQGKAVQWHRMEEEVGRTLGGHAMASADGEWIYTTETSAVSGQGWLSVRDGRTLRKAAEFRSHGVEPHQVLVGPSGELLVANGGIFRTDQDKKKDLHLMDSSLVRLHPTTGERTGQWRLKDARLSLRHLAWATPEGRSQGSPMLGIALQAEHDDLDQRRAAPVLALWNGDSLETPVSAVSAGGYTGDIVATHDGGFVLSCQREGLAVAWSPSAPQDLLAVAQLKEVCALAPCPSDSAPSGVFMAAANGAGRWHPSDAPALLRWPQKMALDNHWAVVERDGHPDQDALVGMVFSTPMSEPEHLLFRGWRCGATAARRAACPCGLRPV